MPNLVGLRDIPSPPMMEDQGKRDTILAIQMEALGMTRRDFLSTRDFKENRLNYISTSDLEPQRLVNKGSIGKREKSKLEGWNNAWTHLQDDGTDAQNLQIVNEGLGQTHRARLMQESNVGGHIGELDSRGREYSGRGHNARRVTDRDSKGKAKGERRVTSQSITPKSITRVRVPKGHHPTTTQPFVPRGQTSPMLKTISPTKATKGRINTLSVPAVQQPVVLAAPDVFMASIKIRREQNLDESSIKVTHPLTNNSKNEAAGIKSTTGFSDERLMPPVSSTFATDTPTAKTSAAASKPVASRETHPKSDLMDSEIHQHNLPPVLQFTAPSMKEQPSHRIDDSASFHKTIEALEKTGRLKATELEILKKIQAQVYTRENQATPVKEDRRQGTYTGSELESLRRSGTKVTNSIARKLAEQQNIFLIGEHVHKTRYQAAASLTEDFEKLTISEKKPVELTETDLPSTESSNMICNKPAKPTASNIPRGAEKSRMNPFGPPPVKGKGPSLPAHLSNLNSTSDHGAAARAQYLGDHGILAAVSDRQPLKDLSVPTRPTRRNKINETGFIALAENRGNIAAGKKGEDPLIVAHKRGL